MNELTMSVNWLAVGVGAVLSFALGSLWFSPMMFGEKWAAGVGVDIDNKKEMPIAAMTLQLIGTCLLAWVIGITAASGALMLAILVGLTIGVLLIASGLFDDNGRYAALAEGAFPIAMCAIMILCHVVL